jgi:putative endonuclease
VLLERLARWLTRSEADDLGARGERAAAAYLRRRGLRVIERNWRCRAGEIDLICRAGATLVFVEVKSRESETVSPEEQVDERKEHQVGRAAAVYCRRFNEQSLPPLRFDVVAVVWPTAGKPVIRHHPDAFVPPD